MAKLGLVLVFIALLAPEFSNTIIQPVILFYGAVTFNYQGTDISFKPVDLCL